MCHEIGHAFGLGHTDEIFGNADLGDCMDYTNSPENNLKPTLRNYDFLFQLYGIVPGGTPYTSPTAAPTKSNGDDDDNDNTEDDVDSQVEQQENAGGGNARRQLLRQLEERVPSPSVLRSSPTQQQQQQQRRIRHYPYQVTRDEYYSEELQQAMDDVLDYATGERKRHDQWQLLHQHSHGEAHEVVLKNGHRLQVHYLRA